MPVDAKEGLEAIVAAHGKSMYRVALSIVRDPSLAEDVVQDALTRVWLNLDSYRGDAPIGHWILRITHNAAVSMLRRIRDESWDPALLPENATSDDTARTIEARDDLQQLKLALADLDELSRAMVAMRELEGMSYQAIADTLGVSLALVKIRLFRARKALVEAVESASREGAS